MRDSLVLILAKHIDCLYLLYMKKFISACFVIFLLAAPIPSWSQISLEDDPVALDQRVQKARKALLQNFGKTKALTIDYRSSCSNIFNAVGDEFILELGATHGRRGDSNFRLSCNLVQKQDLQISLKETYTLSLQSNIGTFASYTAVFNCSGQNRSQNYKTDIGKCILNRETVREAYYRLAGKISS